MGRCKPVKGREGTIVDPRSYLLQPLAPAAPGFYDVGPVRGFLRPTLGWGFVAAPLTQLGARVATLALRMGLARLLDVRPGTDLARRFGTVRRRTKAQMREDAYERILLAQQQASDSPSMNTVAWNAVRRGHAAARGETTSDTVEEST